MPQRSVVNCSADQPKLTADCGTMEGAAVKQGLRSECASVWLERSMYERAESQYYMSLQEQQNGTTAPSSTSSTLRNQEACRHGDQEACDHMVQTVWVNKPVFDQAESQFVTQHPRQPNTPSFLQLLPNSPSSNALHDEGYLSQTPTPHTPASRPDNGLPFLPAPLQGVWLQKPLYDRAEASFYESQYHQNVSHCKPAAVREEQAGLEMKSSVQKEPKLEKATEEKPHGGGVKKQCSAVWCYFLHANSERVWLDRSRYVEAETRFYEAIATKTSLTAIGHCSSSQKMSGVDFLGSERIWFDKPHYDEAERRFYERRNGPGLPAQDSGANSILQDIARARENIQKSLAGLKTTLQPTRGSAHKPHNPSHSSATTGGSSADQGEILTRVKKLELENQSLHKVVENLRSALSKLESRVSVLEKRPVAPAPAVNGTAPNKTPPAHPAQTEAEDEDDLDLFGSDEEVDEEAERIKEQRLQEYAAKKAKKPTIIAKSSILLDVKPWDDETDMAKLEECVRSVQVDGLLWGASKLVPVGYGIKKLQINCVVEDDKVGTDLLEEEITKFEDYVQSVDVAAFNKI